MAKLYATIVKILTIGITVSYRFIILIVLLLGFTLFGNAQLSVQLVPGFYQAGSNISCYGGANGTITTQISGGTAPYT